MKKNILVIGASRGIGLELTKHLKNMGHNVFGVSRSRSYECEWIEGDVATEKGIENLVRNVGDKRIDTLIYSAGAWEEKGFMSDFDFLETKGFETRHIMSVNVVAPIEITKRLIGNFAQSNNPRAIYLGALSGVEQLASQQVAYSASKFALRGTIQGLRMALKQKGIGFTVINPGNVATDEVVSDIEQGRTKAQVLIPMSDIISTIDWLMSLSGAVEVGDVNLIQKNSW